MKLRNLLAWSPALCLSAMIVHAQETNEVEQLKKQMRQMQQQIETLTRRLDEVTKAQSPPSNAPPQTAEQKKLEEQLAAELGATNAPAVSRNPSVAKTWSPSSPITSAR